MKSRSGLLIIILILLVLYIPEYAKSVRSIELDGFVYDTSLKFINNSRIEVSYLHNVKEKDEKYYEVIYTDKKGNWKLKVPLRGKICIKTYSNGFVPEKRIINLEIEKSLNNRKVIVRSQMKKGMKQIEWGSFEHHMLYVKSSDQKAIEEFIGSKEKKKVEDYINTNIKKSQWIDTYIFAGYSSFRRGDYLNSKEYFYKSGSKLWFNLMGNKYLQNNEYKKSMDHYLKGITTRTRAYDLFDIGKNFKNNQDNVNGDRCFNAAMSDFNNIITDYRYKWSDDLLRMRYDSYNNLNSKEKHENSEELKDILLKAGEYCKRLKKAEIYYFCNEEKIDKIVLIEDLHNAIETPLKYFKNYKPAKTRGVKLTDKYIYDLQFIIDEKGIVEEARNLVNEYPDLKRNTVPVLSYKVVRPLYGPNTLIGFGWQDFFDYTISGRENFLDVETVMIEAFPKWSSFTNQMYGKFWVNEKDGSILKIEWKHQNLNRKDLRIRGLILNRIPGMRFISTYGKVRAGLRFPSKYRIIEYYSEKSESFVRLDIKGVYKDYTFFGVEIDDVKAE